MSAGSRVTQNALSLRCAILVLRSQVAVMARARASEASTSSQHRGSLVCCALGCLFLIALSRKKLPRAWHSRET
jgi:hypothetical protein